jgi:hypothetical protein
MFIGMEPEEIASIGIFKKVLAIFTRLFPTFCKFLHFFKIILILVVSYFALFNNTLTKDYSKSTYDNTTLTTAQIDSCYKNINSTFNATLSSYKSQILVFGGIEFASIIICSCVLSIIKSVINIEGYFMEPDDPRIGSIRKLLFRKLGP